jgi:nucleoside phosphorylase
LKDTFLDQFQDELWFIIQFGPNLGWRKPLRKKVSYLLESKRTLGAQEISTYQYDLAVIAALHDPELAKVKPFIKEIERFRVDRDTDYYFRGFFERDGKRISVVAAAAPQMGMTASAVLATKMIKHFRPRYLGMVGIAAGVNGQCNLGDILVADRVWDYGSGKIKTDKTRGKVFQPDPKQIPLDFDLLAKFQDIALDKTLFDEIQKDYSGPSEIKSKLKVVIGPLASGAAVVQHEETVKEILDKNRKLVGLEMETYAVFYAAEYSDAPRPLPFSIKSACDFANKKKNDKFQDYAAHTSAQFLYYFATSNLME